MGIPSFYRHLCRRFPTLITAGSGPRPEWLCLDFNCAMYYVLRKMRPVAEAVSKSAWEGEFCDAIANYMAELVRLVAPTKGVYVSCDGAVCAAKRRQQRLRRFKGPWISALEAQVTGIPVATDKWDQNALTPGSAFMERLGLVLLAAGAALGVSEKLIVVVSTTKEPGEGEHKLLAYMRKIRPLTCTIYGLDADLILLSMLLGVDTGASVRLLREAQEFEARSSASGWRTLDIGGLVRAILPSAEAGIVRDFVAAMTLLGNDFLPRSLTHTVRDDGIPDLVRTLQTAVWAAGLSLVGLGGEGLNRQSLLALIQVWAMHEERDLVVAAAAAQKAARYPPGIGATPEETALKEWNSQPARWATVCQILYGHDKLKRDWRTIYERWGPGSAADYVKGLAWTWDYYAGKPVDQGWFFEEHLPPLWQDVASYLTTVATLAAPLVIYPTPLPDWLHLLAVLPADSVVQLLGPKAQALMGSYSWYWPTSWSVFDVGRGQLWECEPLIPVIPEVILRKMLG
jgi:5'-3' exonuclease